MGAVGIVTALLAGQFGDRIQVGTRFSAPVQTGPGAHSASYSISTVSFTEVKRPGSGVNYASSAEVKKRVELHFYPAPLLSLNGSYRVTFTCTFTSQKLWPAISYIIPILLILQHVFINMFMRHTPFVC